MFDSEHIIDRHEFAFENLKITINERRFKVSFRIFRIHE